MYYNDMEEDQNKRNLKMMNKAGCISTNNSFPNGNGVLLSSSNYGAYHNNGNFNRYINMNYYKDKINAPMFTNMNGGLSLEGNQAMMSGQNSYYSNQNDTKSDYKDNTQNYLKYPSMNYAYQGNYGITPN